MSIHTEKPPVYYGSRNPGAVIIGGHFQSLGIIRNLGQHNIPLCLLDNKLCIGRFSRYTSRYFRCPPIKDEPLFLEFLLTLAHKARIEGWIIYPNDDETVIFLSKNRNRLEKYYRIPTPPWEVIRYASERKLTYQLAEKFDIDTPYTCYPRDLEEVRTVITNFPAVLKPSVKEPFYSLIGKNAIRVNNRFEMIQTYKRIKSICPSAEILVQEYIPAAPDNLFSLGSMVRGGELTGKVAVRILRRYPREFGRVTTCAEIMDIPELEHIARRFLRAMGYYGLSEIEFMLDKRDGKFKLIEMNARLRGWHTLTINTGIDLPYLLYMDMLGHRARAEGFTPGFKWLHLLMDIPASMGEIIKGRMSVMEYIKSLRGQKKDAVLSSSDPLPFLIELLMFPYFWMKKG